MAVSVPPFAASVGPVHFFGCANSSFHVATAFLASSSSEIVTVRVSMCPLRTSSSQAARSVDPTSPRLSVTSSALNVFWTLRTVLTFSLPLRYSAYCTSKPRPLTSEKPPTIVPSSPEPWSPPRATRKLNAPYGLSRCTAMPQPSSGPRVGRELADPEDHELRRFGRRHPDQADQPTVVEVVLGHRRAVAADEERLLRGRAEQRTGQPLHVQEILDRAADRVPQPG